MGRRLNRAGLALAVALTVVAVPAGTALAALAPDQTYSVTGVGVEFIHDVTFQGQTYTAGVTGALQRLDLTVGRLSDPGPLKVEIRATAAGLPTATVLATALVPTAAVPADGGRHAISVDLPDSLSTAGTQYTIVLSARNAPSDSSWFWAIDSLNGYAAGTDVDSVNAGSTWTIRATKDRSFTTYVDPEPCAPGSWSAIGYGHCTPADTGSFVDAPGATAQTPCDLGTYQPDPGATACINAPIGSYVDTAGATSPTACPDGTTTAAAGSTSAADCVAIAVDPPTIACAATPGSIWPPNNKLVAVHVTVTTTHATAFQLVSATSDEDASALSGWSIGSADVDGSVRASRDGDGDGRVYSLTYVATNDGDQTASCTATVSVPHDQGHK